MSGEAAVAVLQFHFDQASLSATLLASAYNPDGLNLSDAVAAIGPLAIPEPSVSVLGVLGLGFLLLRRKR